MDMVHPSNQSCQTRLEFSFTSDMVCGEEPNYEMIMPLAENRSSERHGRHRGVG
jgi:hypothetical protein